MSNDFKTILEEGTFKVEVRVDESELITVRVVNSIGKINSISLYEEEWESILKYAKSTVDGLD